MPSIPPLDTYILVSYALYPMLGAIAAWSLFWALIGYLIGVRPRPTQLIFLPENRRSYYEDERPVDLRTGAAPTVEVESPPATTEL